MYRCEKCKEVIPEKTTQSKVIVKRRPKIYGKDRKGKMIKGWEIEKEISVCSSCYDTLGDCYG